MKDEVDGEKRRRERKRQEECETLGPLNDEPSFEGRFRSDSAQGFCCVVGCCGLLSVLGIVCFASEAESVSISLF
ncbi:uncharacterized protein ASPGLDRAFT_50413 [Aspergillus glaucus CBS 516.65]|uniref:Transmembrane protein n=1 Tax=Aspergillus glaucus CBS 516.65 TaxID=1160497 RepID=A0A1L9VBS1_ASPGL|nr:hypothetical protein ASPGLDRAFT_50413 [Aspergillus glaucus CBS 516.65]OJJ81350.1 hypothetical protein ASPGLDRAFT_50413 [Aspergillus glaucus CBS 516.65]